MGQSAKRIEIEAYRDGKIKKGDYTLFWDREDLVQQQNQAITIVIMTGRTSPALQHLAATLGMNCKGGGGNRGRGEHAEHLRGHF